MISNTEYQIKYEGERYTVKVEYVSFRGCFRHLMRISVYNDVVIVVYDSDGQELQIRPYIYSLNSEVDLIRFRQVALEGKQKFLREINNETVTVQDNFLTNPELRRK